MRGLFRYMGVREGSEGWEGGEREGWVEGVGEEWF